MYVDDIVKWTVINNVNMFFLNKDFNKIASNERLSVMFLLQRDHLVFFCENRWYEMSIFYGFI